MLEIVGDLWYFRGWGYWICVPTNGIIKKDGSNVMGRGLALQTKQRFPGFDKKLGQAIKEIGNRPLAFTGQKIITFPVKYHWSDKADLNLIRDSATALVELVDKHSFDAPFYLPRVGCGNGKRKWDTEVYPILNSILDDRFVIVKLGE